MTTYQIREAQRLGFDRHERHIEQDWRAQIIADKQARQIREENFRLTTAARRH